MGKFLTILIILVVVFALVFIAYPHYYTPDHFQSIDHFSYREENYPVDVVVTWLDTSDKNWWKEYREVARQNNITTKHESPTSPNEASKEIYYCIKGIRKNMPWIRNLFLFTQRPQKPIWYGKEDLGVKLVHHDEVFPHKTYSGMVTCAETFNIPGLSEHYVQFEDDIYVTKPVKKEYFFKSGKPIQRVTHGSYFLKMLSSSAKGFSKIIYNTLKMLPFSLHTFSGIHSPVPCTKTLVFEAKKTISSMKWDSLSPIRDDTDFDFAETYLRNYLCRKKRDDVIATTDKDFVSFLAEKKDFDPKKASLFSIVNINNALEPLAERYLREVLQI